MRDNVNAVTVLLVLIWWTLLALTYLGLVLRGMLATYLHMFYAAHEDVLEQHVHNHPEGEKESA